MKMDEQGNYRMMMYMPIVAARTIISTRQPRDAITSAAIFSRVVRGNGRSVTGKASPQQLGATGKGRSEQSFACRTCEQV